jgi:hypothetical protein
MIMVGVVLATALLRFTAPAGAAAAGCTDPTASAYATHDCKVQRLRERSFTVIAVVDQGINPYNIDFHLDPDDDMIGVHPSEYIEGYPADANRMALSFDAQSVAQARTRDYAQWKRAESSDLSWVDGTNIIGGHSAIPGDFGTDAGHGTPVASQAAGRFFGPNHKDVLIVMARDLTLGLDWAVKQPWIDVITGSWSTGGDTAPMTRAAVAQGKTVCFATGNFTVPLWAYQQQGPSWHVNVGAEHEEPLPGAYYSGTPADVLGITNVKAADSESMTDSKMFNGTSGATPAVCGLIADTISKARSRMGDTSEGPSNGVVAVGAPGGGPSSDGRLTRAEVEDAVMATARPSSYLPAATYVRGGYGIVDKTTVKQALKVLFGEAPRPQRPDEDRWIQTTDAARNAIYGAPPP